MAQPGNGAIAEEAPPKRRRGRPRKEPLPGTALLNVQVEGFPPANTRDIEAGEVGSEILFHCYAHAVASSLPALNIKKLHRRC